MDNIKLKYIESRLEFEKNHLIELLPEQFKKHFAWYAYIAGGCIYSLYNNTEPKDYDFFLRNEKFAKKLRDYFKEVSGYHGKTISGGTYQGYPLTITDNAISIGRYQIITQWIGKPQDVVEQFDFGHNQFYYSGSKVDTTSNFDFLDTKALIYNDKRARDIVGTISRIPKFIERGMKISQKEVAKMLLKLNEVGFNKRELEILEEAKDKSEAVEHFGS